ncbi:peptidoglycan-binding domain-containing protein [Nakamurella multipartita]|uniref:Peptidoglycan-binding domain 1 protein n=1 Tax=Nakamurella multipartita (strain ATCC 700099 / DSM 44233 / CIP 104796 / JCM 9543 / NBRC 105858 / Y-104) TaxID=479431 RepID=C8X6H8_NAKMY|nr:peptidoglycan-binding protein [Nakamurella multipartita]ACV78833.1 Peptidoglycan-binding domain 1 protein [Nakamurella multipartita DSM 44233]
MRRTSRAIIAALLIGLAVVVVAPSAWAGPPTAAGELVVTVSATHRSAVPAVGTWPVLSHGVANSAVTVRSLQYLLNAHASCLAVDGVFGPRTTAAVRNFQARHALVVDGIVGPQTWTALLVTIRRGSVGPAVQAFQDQMNARAVAAGQAPFLAVDGIFGPKTESAVYYFQNRLADYWGTTVDGIVGPQTWQPTISNVLPRG